MDHLSTPAAPLPDQAVSKWDILNTLRVIRKQLGVSDRALGVLQALLSFHPHTLLDPATGLVVHPSNDSICERLNGMPCSTMRRHLAALVAAGLLVRRDSPNGKRFARKFGGEKVAFGFDLTPLLQRLAEFLALAETTKAAQDAYDRMRLSAILIRRDLAHLVAYGMNSDQPEIRAANWDALDDLARLSQRALARSISPEDLTELTAKLSAALKTASRYLALSQPDLSTKPAQIEHHHQNSKEETSDNQIEETKAQDSILPLAIILEACTEFASFQEQVPSNWTQFQRATEKIRPMMGLSINVWEDAKQKMGDVTAAITLAAMLERFTEIKSPNGYLRALSQQSQLQKFSSVRLIMALLNTRRDVHSCEPILEAGSQL